jgi:hypothetical protein
MAKKANPSNSTQEQVEETQVVETQIPETEAQNIETPEQSPAPVAEAALDAASAEEGLDAQQILTDAKTQAANLQAAIDEAPAEGGVTPDLHPDIFAMATLAYEATLSLFFQLSDVYESLTDQPFNLDCWMMGGRVVPAALQCALTEYVITRRLPISGETLWRKASELGVHHYPSNSFEQQPLPVQKAYGHYAMTVRTNHAALMALRKALTPDPVATASPPVGQDQTIFETLGNVLGLDPDLTAKGK